MGYGKTVRKAIGGRISELRAKKGLTQKQLGEALHISATYVNRIEAGDKAVPDAHMDLMMETLGASAADLLGPVKAEPGPQELAYMKIVELFRGAGVEESELLMELMNYFVKGSAAERAIIMKSLQGILMARRVSPISEMQLIERIRSFVRVNSTQGEESVDEMHG
jgi:transcriptional regulator with XRE-family HTH domain